MSISIKKFKVDYADSPIGVKSKQPKFSWVIDADGKNIKQEGYSLKVCEWIDEPLWETGFVESDETINIKYKGKALVHDTLYIAYLTVRVNGEEISAKTEFRTGLMGNYQPRIKWINTDLKEAECQNAPYFRREFALKSDEVAYATAYIACRGWCELYVNGERADKDQMLSMTICRYDHAAVRAHDITNLLKSGMNAVGVSLGSGFSDHYRPGAIYNAPKRFWAFISVVFTDGSYQQIWTDENWKWHRSPIIMNHIYDGEWYDARLQMPGWNKPGFNDADWENAIQSKYGSELVDSFGPPIKIIGTRPTHKTTQIGENTYIYDFKYNGSGVLKIKVKGDPGAEVIMHHAENIHDDGTLQPWTNRNAEATDRYILKGEGEEIYVPRFTYHCFRYVEFALKGNVEVLEAEALVIGSDVFNTESHFECSNPLINRIQENFMRTLKTNFMSWPADTGVRDERTSCNMDSLVYEEMAMHNCDMHNYYENWFLRNVATEGRPDWDGENIVNVWLMHKYYGDTDFVKQFYPDLISLAYNFYCIHRGNFREKEFAKGYGDWTAPSKTNDYEDSYSCVKEVNYGMWYLEMYILRDLAKIAGEESDIPQIEKFMEYAREYYEKNLYNPETGLYSDENQIPNIFALVSPGLIPEERKDEVLIGLIKMTREKYDSHHYTGIYGTRLFIEALAKSEEGLELSYDMLTQTTYPSYGRQIVGKDATTAWEQWYNQQGMMTCSHSMYTGIGVDFYKKFAGITTLENCYKKALIKPIAPSKLTYVNCTLETLRGNYTVNWKRDDGKMKLQVTVPANCEAIVEMPDGTRHEIGSGSYEF